MKYKIYLLILISIWLYFYELKMHLLVITDVSGVVFMNIPSLSPNTTVNFYLFIFFFCHTHFEGHIDPGSATVLYHMQVPCVVRFTQRKHKSYLVIQCWTQTFPNVTIKNMSHAFSCYKQMLRCKCLYCR